MPLQLRLTAHADRLYEGQCTRKQHRNTRRKLRGDAHASSVACVCASGVACASGMRCAYRDPQWVGMEGPGSLPRHSEEPANRYSTPIQDHSILSSGLLSQRQQDSCHDTDPLVNRRASHLIIEGQIPTEQHNLFLYQLHKTLRLSLSNHLQILSIHPISVPKRPSCVPFLYANVQSCSAWKLMSVPA